MGDGTCLENRRASRPWGFDSLTLRTHSSMVKRTSCCASNAGFQVRFLVGLLHETNHFDADVARFRKAPVL